jgi:hypothetical protein
MRESDVGEIINLLNLYALAVDTLQWDLLGHVFVADARVEYEGGAVWTDLASFQRDFAAVHAPLTTSQHVVTNHQVIVDGDLANAISYNHARLFRTVQQGGGNHWEIGAWYDDVLTRTRKGWRITHRISRGHWWDGSMPVTETLGIVAKPEMTRLHPAAAAGKIAYVNALKGRQ